MTEASDEALLQRVDDLAEKVLWPAAAEVDRADRVPESHLDALAQAGLFGLTAPTSVGGAAASPALVDAVVERLAGACLSTTFVWIQHLGVVARVAAAGGPVADRWLADLASGRVRAGVAIGGVRPGVEPLLATEVADGWRLDGPVPWLTGWGLVDVVLVAARQGTDLLWFLLDVRDGVGPEGMRTHRFELVATDAARSVVVAFDGVRVEADRLVAREDYQGWQGADHLGLGMNAALGLGIARRCANLLVDAGESELGDAFTVAVDDLSARLAAADPRRRRRADGRSLHDLRAETGVMAWQAAGALATAVGGRSLSRDSDAERLVRHAHFCLVFGSRPEIRRSQLGNFTPDDDQGD